MRETWFLKNVHGRELTISDLDKAPAIKPNETVDMLRYHTKQEIEQSESLAAAITANWVTLIKRRDNETTVKTTPDDINISIENAEIDESVRYYGEIYADDASITVTINAPNTPVKIASGLSGGSQNGLVFQNGCELRIVIPGTYSVNWSISADTNTAGQEIMGVILKNSVRQPNGTNHATVVAPNKAVPLAGAAILPGLIAGDLLGVGVSNETTVNDIMVEHVNFVMLRIGN